MNVDYKEWIKRARERLKMLQYQRSVIDIEMAALERSIQDFEPLVGESVLRFGTGGGSFNFPTSPSDLHAEFVSDTFGLTEAIRRVLKNNTVPLEPTEIRDELVHGGFNLMGRSNAMANIHQTLRRLVVQGEIREVPTTSGKTVYEWAGARFTDGLG